MHKPSNFHEFISGTSWRDYPTYFNEAQSELRQEIEKNTEGEVAFRNNLRARLRSEFSANLRHVTDSELNKAREELRGNVCAIDGTMAKVELMSGVRSQIGIVAVNYQNEKASYVTYVTEASYTQYDSAEDVMETLKSRKKEKRVVSDLVLRATMAYWEREHALEQAPEWKVIHGELFPWELRNGLGKLQAMDTCLALFRRMAKQPKIGSVVSDTGGIDRFLGYALEPYQYFVVESLRKDYTEWLADEAHFSRDDEAKFTRFIDDTAGKYYKCIYRVGPRPFVFFAHQDVMQDFAAILMADASLIPERGFPILVDYADSICANLFRASDFERRVEHELAINGEVLTEQSERARRQR